MILEDASQLFGVATSQSRFIPFSPQSTVSFLFPQKIEPYFLVRQSKLPKAISRKCPNWKLSKMLKPFSSSDEKADCLEQRFALTREKTEWQPGFCVSQVFLFSLTNLSPNSAWLSFFARFAPNPSADVNSPPMVVFCKKIAKLIRRCTNVPYEHTRARIAARKANKSPLQGKHQLPRLTGAISSKTIPFLYTPSQKASNKG